MDSQSTLDQIILLWPFSLFFLKTQIWVSAWQFLVSNLNLMSWGGHLLCVIRTSLKSGSVGARFNCIVHAICFIKIGSSLFWMESCLNQLYLRCDVKFFSFRPLQRYLWAFGLVCLPTLSFYAVQLKSAALCFSHTLYSILLVLLYPLFTRCINFR